MVKRYVGFPEVQPFYNKNYQDSLNKLSYLLLSLKLKSKMKDKILGDKGSLIAS